VRRKALLRAQNKCECCGDYRALQLHHRGSVLDPSLFNCQVLCDGCHVAEHAKRKRKSWC
jgi:hypothetical protein